MKFFDLDGTLYKIGSDIADGMILSFIWLLFCIPIVTIGASTTTVFYIYGKKARGEDTYLIKDFVKSFKQNFMQSLPMTILFVVMWVSMYAYHMLIDAYAGEAPLALVVLAYFFTVEVIIMTLYSFSILSRFHMKTSKILLSAFILGHKHFKQTGIILLGIVVVLVSIRFLPVLMVFTPVIIMAFSSLLLQKIFTQHIKLAKEMEEQIVMDEALVEETKQLDEKLSEGNTEKHKACEESIEEKDYLKYI